jgi:hypothetical protein
MFRHVGINKYKASRSTSPQGTAAPANLRSSRPRHRHPHAAWPTCTYAAQRVAVWCTMRVAHHVPCMRGTAHRAATASSSGSASGGCSTPVSCSSFCRFRAAVFVSPCPPPIRPSNRAENTLEQHPASQFRSGQKSVGPHRPATLEIWPRIAPPYRALLYAVARRTAARWTWEIQAPFRYIVQIELLSHHPRT